MKYCLMEGRSENAFHRECLRGKIPSCACEWRVLVSDLGLGKVGVCFAASPGGPCGGGVRTGRSLAVEVCAVCSGGDEVGRGHIREMAKPVKLSNDLAGADFASRMLLAITGSYCRRYCFNWGTVALSKNDSTSSWKKESRWTCRHLFLWLCNRRIRAAYSVLLSFSRIDALPCREFCRRLMSCHNLYWSRHSKWIMPTTVWVELFGVGSEEKRFCS